MTIKPQPPFECYKCGAATQLMVEDHIREDTKEVVASKFICLRCASNAEREKSNNVT